MRNIGDILNRMSLAIEQNRSGRTTWVNEQINHLIQEAEFELGFKERPKPFTIPSVVGIAGYKGSGKNTAAEILVRCGYKQKAFADALKRLAVLSNPFFTVQFSAVEYMNGVFCNGNILPADSRIYYGCGPAPLSTIVEQLGWDEAKKYTMIRKFLQNLGNGAREAISENVWIDIVCYSIIKHLEAGARCVITDVRYPNECDLIKTHGYQTGHEGFLIWIDREGCESDGHPSENPYGREHADAILTNNGTKEDLWHKILTLFQIPYTAEWKNGDEIESIEPLVDVMNQKLRGEI